MIQRTLFRLLSEASYTPRRGPEIVQRWVETADERCPLACVWFALAEILDQPSADPADEADSTRPAFSWFALKAGNLRLIHILSAPSI